MYSISFNNVEFDRRLIGVRNVKGGEDRIAACA